MSRDSHRTEAGESADQTMSVFLPATGTRDVGKLDAAELRRRESGLLSIRLRHHRGEDHWTGATGHRHPVGPSVARSVVVHEAFDRAKSIQNMNYNFG
jgi:hypothetical protein